MQTKPAQRQSLKISALAVTGQTLREVYHNMKRDFPASERIPRWLFKRALKMGTMKAVCLTDQRGSEEYGYMVYQTEPSLDAAYIMYFAIHPQHRQGGYGSAFLHLMGDYTSASNILLEVEDPRFAQTEEEKKTMEKRIGFYRKNGFAVLPNASISLFGVRMVVMATAPLAIDNYETLYRKLYKRAFSFWLPKRAVKWTREAPQTPHTPSGGGNPQQ